jgi:sodium pump decarboxylase gamma subunit
MNVAGFLEGFPTFLIGVTVVFVTLFLMIGVINVMGKAIAKIEGSAKNKTKAAPVKVAPTPMQPIEEEQVDDLELVAVITVAIAASIGTSADTLQVRSLRNITKNTL